MLQSVAAQSPSAVVPTSGSLTEANWRDADLIRIILKKNGLSGRLGLYRSWLSMASVEMASVSEVLGRALASDIPSLDSGRAREIVDLVARAMSRKAGFWAAQGEARETLVAAILDRSEPELISTAMSLSALVPTGFPLNKKRVAGMLSVIGEGRKVLSEPESAALWAVAVASLSRGAELPSARALAARIVETSHCSLWTWSSRVPALTLPNLALAFSDPRLPIEESRLFLAIAGAVGIGARGSISLAPRFSGDEAMKRLFETKVTSGDPACRDLEALYAVGGSSGPSSRRTSMVFDTATLKGLGDWEAGLSLLRFAREARAGEILLSEAQIISLMDVSRPTQAAVAASLLAGSRSPAAVSALSSVVRDTALRDPALLIVAIRALAAVAGSDCRDILPRLRGQDTGVRLAAIDALGALRDPRAVDPLGALLLDAAEDAAIKRACAKSLGAIGDAGSGRILQRFLITPRPENDADDAARVHAAMSLGQKREKGAVRALLDNIDPAHDSDLNYHCVIALGRIADPAGLQSLLPLVRKGLPQWTQGTDTRTATAAQWALLPLEPGLARQFHLDRWNAGSRGKNDPATWYAALYLLGDAHKGGPGSATDQDAWTAFLERGLRDAIADDCVMAGEALDRTPVPAVLSRVATLLKDLDPYSKSWLAVPLMHHPTLAMIPAFRFLLDGEDDFLVYAGLASMDHLISALPSPLTPELKSQLADFQGRLSSLTDAQIAGGTSEWRDVVRKRLGNLLDSGR